MPDYQAIRRIVFSIVNPTAQSSEFFATHPL